MFGAETKKYLKLGVEHGSGTCAFEYAKLTYYSFEVGAIMGNMKSGLTADEKAEAARLFIIALGKNIHGAYHYALNAFEFLPDTEKSNASKIIYDYFISITDVGKYTKNGDIYNYSNPIFGGKWELAAYIGSDKTLVIPEGIDVISGGAFCSHAPIENIVFPKSLKKISASVFSGMAYLRTVELQSAAEIGEDAFSGCKQLSEVKLSTGIIGHGAFMNCTSLVSVHIPEGTKTVLRDAFRDCTSLENVSLPESLDFAGACVFDGCDKLSMTEWGGVSYLACGNNPYAWAYKITSAPEKLTYHPDTKIITTMTSLEDKKYIFDNVKEIEFPKSVSCISYGCLNYRGVAKLTVPPREAISEDFISGEYSEIIISEGTKFVDRWSIKYTGKGSCHVWLPESIKTVTISAFLGTGITVHAPEGKKLVKKIFTTTSKKNPNEIVYYTPGTPIGGTGNGAVESVSTKEEPRPKVLLLDDGTAITSDGKTLGRYGEVIADSNNNSAGAKKSTSGAKKSTTATPKASTAGAAKKPAEPKVNTPAEKSAEAPKPKVEAPKADPDFIIEDGTLIKYSGNQSFVEIPKGVHTIDGYAFDSRSDIYSITIPEGVLFINTRAFVNCRRLVLLKLPRSVEYIGNDAFFGCTSLKVHVCKTTTCEKHAFRTLKLFAVKKYK